MREYLGTSSFVALVHRAKGFGLPENTTAAIERSLRMGFHYVETDIRTTRDGTAVLNHDPSIPRGHRRIGKINELTYRELSSILRSEGRDAPRLGDLLTMFPDL